MTEREYRRRWNLPARCLCGAAITWSRRRRTEHRRGYSIVRAVRATNAHFAQLRRQRKERKAA